MPEGIAVGGIKAEPGSLSAAIKQRRFFGVRSFSLRRSHRRTRKGCAGFLNPMVLS
jgi:hypothetical protein